MEDKNLIIKWEETGYLYGAGENKLLLAKLLEKAKDLILSKSEKYNEMSILVIPAIVRLFHDKKVNPEIDIEMVLSIAVNSWVKFKEMISNLFTCIDVEHCFITLIKEEYTNRKKFELYKNIKVA